MLSGLDCTRNMNMRHVRVRKHQVYGKCGQVGPAEHNMESLTKHNNRTRNDRSLTSVVVDESVLSCQDEMTRAS
jgi:hypothetical protein